MATHTHAAPDDPTPGLARWAAYLRERFPPATYAVALGLFTGAAIAYGRAVEGREGWPPAYPFAAAFAATWLVFLQLRIADEFKDAEDDAKYRPERPVPRGLVTLEGLARLWIVAAAVALALAASLGGVPLAWLAAVLAYSGLMRVEFFAPAWLKARPLAYLATHMLIVPLVAAFILACASVAWRAELAPFLALAYALFCVFELGRKTWAPREERTGVETYSALWGARRAVRAWLAAIAAAALLALAAATGVGIAVPCAVVVALLAIASAVVATRFLADPPRARGSRIAAMSGAWFVGILLLFAAEPIFRR